MNRNGCPGSRTVGVAGGGAARVLAVVLLTATARVAGAHDALASNVNVWVRASGLDVEIYMARSAGADVIAAKDEQINIYADTFDKYKDRLAAAGPGLVELTAGGETLTAVRTAVGMTDENDVRFDLHYPLPAGGPLRIHLGYLTKMAEGHVATAYAMDSHGADLGWGELTVEKQDLDARLPQMAAAATEPSGRQGGAGIPPGTAPGPGKEASAGGAPAVVGQSTNVSPGWVLPAGVAAAVAVVGGVAVARWARKAK